MSDSMISALGRMAECCRFFVYLLTWNAEHGKFAKKPVGSPAAASLTYAQARAEVMRLRTAGTWATVGLWIAEDCGLWFLDIDKLPADYELDDRARDLLSMFPGAFMEWSSSRRGIHIVGTMATGVEHGSRSNALHLEFYTQGRGIALNIDAPPGGCMDSVHDVSALVAQYFPPRDVPSVAAGPHSDWRGTKDDEELIRRALAARDSAAVTLGGRPSFAQLWNGEADGNSENDAALAMRLAFWTGCNAERVARLMWRSGLVRDKWRSHRTYLDRTIAKACAECSAVYQAPPLVPTKAQSKVRNATDLMAQKFKPVQWAIQGILPEGVTILSGDPKIGKSWLVYQMCVAITGGVPLWNGRPPERQGEALYLDLEGNDRRLQRRLGRLLAGFPPNTDTSRLNFATEWGRAEVGVSEIAEWLRDHPDCRIVVIDTVSAFRDNDPGRKSAYAHDYAVGEMLKPLAKEFSCSIVLVMHNRKQSAGDVMHKVSGTQGMTGSVDNVLVLERNRADMEAALHIDGRDIEEPAQLAMRFEGGLWRSVGTVAEVQRTNERKQVLQALVSLRGAGTAKDIHEAMGGTQKLSAVRMRLSRMVKSGELQNAMGLYTAAVDFTPTDPPKPTET